MKGLMILSFFAVLALVSGCEPDHSAVQKRGDIVTITMVPGEGFPLRSSCYYFTVKNGSELMKYKADLGDFDCGVKIFTDLKPEEPMWAAVVGRIPTRGIEIHIHAKEAIKVVNYHDSSALPFPF